MVTLLVPEMMATGNWFTVTVVVPEKASVQTPLFTTALNWVVWFKTPEVYVVAVFAISFQTVPLIDDCHLVTEPWCPDRVRTPLVLPAQMEVPPVTDPATVGGSTVMVAAPEIASTQSPF